MPSQLSDDDYDYLRILLEERILTDVLPQEVSLKGGVVAITCADGDQWQDINETLRLLCLCNDLPERVHMIRLNGGAALVAEDSPLVQEFREDKVIIHHAKNGMILKEIDTILDIVHFRCGATSMFNLTAHEVMRLAVAGKFRLRKETVSEQVPVVKVVCLAHVDFADRYPFGKKMLHLAVSKWLQWTPPDQFLRSSSVTN